MEVIKGANLALRILLEVGSLVALGYWGFQVGEGRGTKFLLGIGVPVLVIIVWPLFDSPNASVTLPAPVKLILGIAILELADVSLAAAGRTTVAVVCGVIVVLNAVLMVVWQQ